MMLNNSILAALRGYFVPDQFGARLFMHSSDIADPNDYLVWFHERFHFLQSVFSPYGHQKWGAYRTVTSDVIGTWLSLTKLYGKELMIPIVEYLDVNDKDSTKIATNVWLNNTMYQLYEVIETGNENAELLQLAPTLFSDTKVCPEIFVLGGIHKFRVIDIVESYAKFEEALMAELILGKSLDVTIDPSKLNPEYYIALYYFVEQLGEVRLMEFPLVCELSLCCAHMIKPTDPSSIRKYTPNWRFFHIIDVIRDKTNLPKIDPQREESFFEYANMVLSLCGYESYENSWESAEIYAQMSDLNMAIEMRKAIAYKKSHPWMLSYPMFKPDFFSQEFNSFEPYFTITNDGVRYNTDRITSTELVFENHYQALSSQICGYPSRYCQDSFRLMCGYAFVGTNTCPHLMSGECDGYVDRDSHLPDLILDDQSNIKSGCSFEIVLNTLGIRLKDIKIKRIRPLHFDEIKSTIEEEEKS